MNWSNLHCPFPSPFPSCRNSKSVPTSHACNLYSSQCPHLMHAIFIVAYAHVSGMRPPQQLSSPATPYMFLSRTETSAANIHPFLRILSTPAAGPTQACPFVSHRRLPCRDAPTHTPSEDSILVTHLTAHWDSHHTERDGYIRVTSTGAHPQALQPCLHGSVFIAKAMQVFPQILPLSLLCPCCVT